MNLLFYAVNGGLGHISRTITLMKEIKKHNNKHELYLTTYSKFAEKLMPKKMAKVIMLPDYTIDRVHFFQKLTAAVRRYNPGIIVYDPAPDTFPAIMHLSGIKNILILRKFDNVTLNFFTMTEPKYFDRIIMPHEGNELKNLAPENLFKKLMGSGRIAFVGPIVKKLDKNLLKKVKDKYRITEKDFTILVSAGGGGHQGMNETFIKEALKAISYCKEKIKNIKPIVILGPYYNKKIKNKNEAIIKTFEPNLIELISLSNLFITHAGYNSVNEAIKAKTPSIIIPMHDWPTFPERQLDNAAKIEKNRLGVVLRTCESKTLTKIVLRFYKDKKFYNKIKSNLNAYEFEEGNEKAAKIILEIAKNVKR